MAINTFMAGTLNPNPNAVPTFTVTTAPADGLSVTLSYDSNVITTKDQLRQFVALAVAQSSLAGP